MDIKIVLNAWQRQDDRIVFKGDPEETVKQLRRKQRRFFVGLLFSDFLEAGAAIGLACLFTFWVAPKFGKQGVFVYISAAVLLLLAAFFIVDRLRQERRPRGRALADEIRHYLLRVNRRIYLLRNVFWWYLLPGIIAWALVVIPAFILTFNGWSIDPFGMTAVFGITIGLAVVVFILVYKLNQYGVEKELVPLKEELEQLLQDLTAEPAPQQED